MKKSRRAYFERIGQGLLRRAEIVPLQFGDDVIERAQRGGVVFSDEAIDNAFVERLNRKFFVGLSCQQYFSDQGIFDLAAKFEAEKVPSKPKLFLKHLYRCGIDKAIRHLIYQILLP